MVETRVRPYRELMPMCRAQVDLENEVVHLPESKTLNGIADMPMSLRAREAVVSLMNESN